jgi:HNH endonuclease
LALKEIALTQGKVAIVDDGDYEWLSQWKWYARHAHGRWSAERRVGHSGPILYMHRVIIGAPVGLDVDHVNSNALDNRRANLRLATRSQNRANSRVRSDSITGVKGVREDKRRRQRRWQALIVVSGRWIHLGCYHNIENAAMAYRFAAQHYFGEFARS